MERIRNRNEKRNSGFTLAELLIVVAIIGVLTGVCIPVFAKVHEQSREATDLANARSAYTALVVAAIEGNTDAAMYDSSAGVYKTTITLRQRKDDWQSKDSKLYVADLRQGSALWLGRPKSGGSATLMLNPNTQQFSIDWQGGSGDASFLSATAPYQYETLMELHASGTSAERKEADRETIQAIGKALLNAVKGMKKAQLIQEYGLFERGGVRLADYYQHKDGDFNGEYWSTGVELVCTDGFLNILDQIGYVGVSQVASVHDTYVHVEGGTTYTKPDVCTSLFENSLFFSDQLAANQYQNYGIDATMRSILLTGVGTDSSGHISSITIQTKAMDGQANLTQQDKEDFTFTINLSDLDP